MTASELAGSRLVKPGERMHATIRELAIMCDAIWLAAENAGGALRSNPEHRVFEPDSPRAEVMVQLRVGGAFEAALWNTGGTADYWLTFPPLADHPFAPTITVRDTRPLLEMVFSSHLVMFHERHKEWIRSNISAEPEVFRFLRAIRNAAAHDGKISITRANDRPVIWRGLSYSHADNGCAIMGTDVSVGDLLMLLFDCSDDLDQRGAPVVL